MLIAQRQHEAVVGCRSLQLEIKGSGKSACEEQVPKPG